MTRRFIMVHHSLTEDGQTVSAPAIERYHVVTNGWRDVGYHAMIELVADHMQFGAAAYQAIMGRPLNAQAAACDHAEMNTLALHVCCVGNYDLLPPSIHLLERLVKRVLLPWMSDFGIPPDRIIGHRDAGLMIGKDWKKGEYKSCPGSKFDLDLVRRMVR